ncbi:MAG: hypothetical protein J6R16_02950 [Alistipes sp.]|nr:hypothetical protein [Alistipes sp.]
MKKIYTTLLLIFAISAIALARFEEPEFPALERNERYMALKRDNTRLKEMEDSVQLLISEARQEFNNYRETDSVTREQIDHFTSFVLSLEQEVFDIRQQRGDVIIELNNLEQEYILTHMYAPERDSSSVKGGADIIEAPIQHRELIKNSIFCENLSKEDYEDLEIAVAEEQEMMTLCDEYTTLYNNLASTARNYMETSDEVVADSLYNAFFALKDEMSGVEEDIDDTWTHILDTKYYVYGYILEKSNRTALLESSSSQLSEMNHRSAAEEGLYASDALMRYVVGHPTLLDFEISIARELELTEALDSLLDVHKSIVMPEYRNEPLNLERRLFIEYEPITFGSTSFYNNNNPLPEVKVYERGTIYRILLGTFRAKQSMSIFKGAKPLFIAQNEEGHYSYYAGGYATLKEAQEAQLMLKEKRGFRRPEVCRWRDGEMTNIDKMEDEGENDENGENVDIVGHRYIVMLECESISDAMRDTITNAAPEKMISRRGSQFAIGTFTEQTEAEELRLLIEESFPDVKASVVELEL